MFILRQIWSDPSERGINQRVHRISPDGRRPPTANRGGREVSPPMALAGLRFFPQIWSDPSERGLDERVHRSSQDGRRTAEARKPTVAAERIHRTWPPPAYVFSRKFFPIRPNGASMKKFAGARRTAAGRGGRRWLGRPRLAAKRIHRPRPSPAYDFSRKYG